MNRARGACIAFDMQHLVSRFALSRCLVIAGALVALGAPREAAAQQDPGMQSPGLFATGVVFSALGIGGLAAGGYFFNQGAGACDGITAAALPTASQIETCKSGVISQVGGVAGMVTGGLFVIAGIPMMAVGGTPEDEDDTPRFAIDAGPTGGTITMSF